MRFPALCLAVLLGSCSLAICQSIPPGAPLPRDYADTPVMPVHVARTVAVPAQPSVDPLLLQRDAKELLELSQSLQPDIDAINHGLLPKDAVEKLKRIEKLTKHLRSQVAPFAK